MNDILIRRFEGYFRHAERDHEVLRIGDRSVACKNVRQAIDWLGESSRAESQSGDDKFDPELQRAGRHLQEVFHHRVYDGEIGPGTRELIVSNLLARFGASIFLRLDRSELDQRPSVFLSYAGGDAPRVDKLD